MLIKYIKIAAVLKHQQFKSNKNNKTELRILKCQGIDIYNNKKKQDLNKYKSEDEVKNIKYILFLFITYLLPSKKKSTC